MRRSSEGKQNKKTTFKIKGKMWRLQNMDSNISFHHSFVDSYWFSMYRNKQIDFVPINIEELTSCKAMKVFYGNVVVTYKAILDKSEKSIEILRVDLTDVKGEMRVTLNFYTNFI